MHPENRDPSNAPLRQVRAPFAGITAALGVLSALGLIYLLFIGPAKPSGRLLLAPMIGQLEPCVSRTALPPEHVIDPTFVACSSDAGSAAAVIDHTLSRLGPRISANGRYELGYTLNVPLLKFLVLRDGQWVLDLVAIDRTIKAIAQSDRRVVLYFFSNHFSAFAPIEPVLAADPANIAQSPQGPIELGKHYGMDVYPWSIARTDNSLTQSRVRVIDAFVKALCEQPVSIRSHLTAITVLGEVHHMFPSFETGMGFTGKYVVSDYSPSSIAGFRSFLRSQFENVQSLNIALGGSMFKSFDEVNPPSKDIRTDTLNHFWDHIDSYAGGYFPVQGWLAPHPRLTGRVQVFVNGKFLAFAHTGLGRQDVADHFPALKSANVGWRLDVAFRDLSPGLYQITTLAESREGLPVLLGSREVAILDKTQAKPPQLPSQKLEVSAPPSGFSANMDSPRNQSDYYFNPLAELWATFRERQVVDYIRYAAKPLRQSCLADVPAYIHQLFPYANPSWDHEKYGVGASLRGASDLNLGVSLYGEASYAESFFSWKNRTWAPSKWPVIDRKKAYGITEFHPLRGMDSAELQGVFDLHRDNGAQFLSFFLEGRGPVNRPYAVKGATIPFLGEANTQNGSDQLYRSVKQLMIQP